MSSNDDLLVNLYRLTTNSELLSHHVGRLHSLAELRTLSELKPDDMAMLKTLTQCVIDYASLIIDGENNG